MRSSSADVSSVEEKITTGVPPYSNSQSFTVLLRENASIIQLTNVALCRLTSFYIDYIHKKACLLCTGYIRDQSVPIVEDIFTFRSANISRCLLLSVASDSMLEVRDIPDTL